MMEVLRKVVETARQMKRLEVEFTSGAAVRAEAARTLSCTLWQIPLRVADQAQAPRQSGLRLVKLVRSW